MFYYIFIIFKRQKKWTILFLWFFTWYCLIVSRETFVVFGAIARVFCRFLFHVKQYQIGGIRRDCYAHRLGAGVVREIDVYI